MHFFPSSIPCLPDPVPLCQLFVFVSELATALATKIMIYTVGKSFVRSLFGLKLLWQRRAMVPW